MLSARDVFLINVPGAWGVIAMTFWFAATREIGFGLIAVYLVLANAMAHIGHAIAQRQYNPGLGTAAALFLPCGLYGLVAVQQAGDGALWAHALGLAVAVLIHAAIVAHALRGRRGAA